MMETTRIEKKVLIQASPGTVFKALTEARDLAHWFCDHATSDPREGGEVVVCWKTGREIHKGRARITHLVKDARLEMLWIDEGRNPGLENARHVLSYAITPRKDNTEVFMCDEDDVPQIEEDMDILSQGWNNVLMELKDYCERAERSARSQSATNAAKDA